MKFWFFSYLVLNLLFLTSCSFLSSVGFMRSGYLTNDLRREVVSHIGKSTIALVKEVETDEDRIVLPYCSGVWISGERILTSYHCLKSEETIHYITWDETRGLGEEPSSWHLGKVIKSDINKDLALIEIIGKAPGHEFAKLANRSPLLTEGLHICGHPRGFYWTFLEGRVASYRDNVPGGDISGPFMQVEAPIYFGNSGGGAFNDRGELVGIADFILKIPNQGMFIHLDSLRKFLGE